MKRATVPAPSPRYAKFAELLRQEGLEVQDNDVEFIDLLIKECDRLLDLRSFLGHPLKRPAQHRPC